MMRPLRYTWVARLVAVLLLVAAGLKLNGLAVDPVGRMGLFSLPAFQIAVVEFELFLAVWLLWGSQPLGSWVTSLGVFALFAAVSAYQGWIGQASCNCFGQLSVSPWYAFFLDMGVLLLLFLGRPDLQALQEPRLLLKNLRPVLFGPVGVLGIGTALAGLGALLYGSLDSALAHLRGERISLYPRLVDVGTGAPGEEQDAMVEVVNRTEHPIRLIGGTKD